MQKTIVALIKDVRERERLIQILNSAEKAGYIVHLFEVGKEESLTNLQLDNVLIYLRNDFQVDGPVSLFSNDFGFLLSSYVEQFPYINYYYLFAEKGMGIPDFHTYIKQPERIACPISVFYKNLEDIMPLILNFLPYIQLHHEYHFVPFIRSYNQLLNPESTDTYKNFISYLIKNYQIPENSLKLFLLQYFDNIKMFDKQLQLINQINQDLPVLKAHYKQSTKEYLETLIRQLTARCKVAILFVLFYLTGEKKYVLSMMDENVLEQLRFNEKYSLYVNIKWLIFVGKVDFLLSETIHLRNFYNTCVDEFASGLKIPKPISPSTRNRDRVIIFTSQFLSMRHSPTRNVVDHAAGLKQLGKEVLIINSEDVLNRLYVPILNGFIGNYIEKYNQTESIKFNGNSFKFYQAKKDMPNIEDAQKMVDLVIDFNPEFVLSMGESAVGDMCSQFTTVIAMNFAGNMPNYRYCFWGITRKLLPEDKKIMNAFEINENQIFPIHFTFRLKEKVEKIKRKDIGIPDDAISLCIIGNRLDQELTETFLTELEYIVNQIDRSYIIILGEYAQYQSVLKKHPDLNGRLKSLGYVNDVRAIYALCNFYLNPLRLGGGSSAAEALLEGVPVITRKYGDVYYQLWLEQSYETKEEVVSYIHKCINNPAYYQEQRSISKKIGQSLYDVDGTNTMMKTLLKNADRIVYGE